MRRRFIQINGELVEVPLNYQSEPRGADSVLWNDRAYQDAGDPRFSSRTQHREFMKKNGLTTIDDFNWSKDEKRRIELRQGKFSTRSDVVEALRKVSSGYKPRLRRE